MGEIEIKDQLSPTEVEIRTEFGNNEAYHPDLTFGNLENKTRTIVILYNIC